MTTAVVTKTGFVLLTPATLVECIKRIEASMPGWRWSISQRKEEIFIDVAPGRNCPHQPDNDWAMTREGDAGRTVAHATGGKVDEAEFLQTVDAFILSFAPTRKLAPGKSGPVEIVHLGPPPYRRQSSSELKALFGAYILLMEFVKPMEERGHLFEEVYFGSCDFSADCSVRGKRVNDSPFDISFDLQGESSIAESLTWTICELKSDVLTPR